MPAGIPGFLRLPRNQSFQLAAPRMGPDDPESSRAARWPAHRPDQRPPHRALFPATVFRGRRRRLPWLEGRPGRHDRRPGRGRRDHQLGRAASGPPGGPPGQVRHPGQPRQRASARTHRRRARPRGLRDAGRAMDDARPRRSDAGDRRNVSPLGPGVRRRATCRRPTSASF